MVGLAHLLLFIQTPSVLSTRLDKSVQFLLGETVLGKEIDIEKDQITNKPRVYRLGKKTPGKNRSIKCHLKSKEMCEAILSQSRRLSESSTFSQVVLQGDLTPLQRSHIRQLVNEKKKRNAIARKNNQDTDWIIRGGKLCRRSDFNNQRCVITSQCNMTLNNFQNRFLVNYVVDMLVNILMQYTQLESFIRSAYVTALCVCCIRWHM